MDEFYKKVAEEYKKGTPVREIIELTGRSKSAIARAVKRLNLEHPNRDNRLNGRIEVDSSLTGVNPMEPTKKQLAEFRQHCEENGLPFDNWRAFWHKTGQYSSFFVNAEADQQFKDQHEQMLKDLRKLSPKYRKRKTNPKGEHMLILPQADIHVGKWSEIAGVGSEYNIDIALNRARQGTAELLAKAKLHGVKQIVVCLGNDVLHTEDGKSTT